MRTFSLAILASFLISTACPTVSSALPITVSLSPVIEATGIDNELDGTYDSITSGSLGIRHFNIPPSTMFDERAVLEFDISSIPTNKTIVDAKLHFTISSYISNVTNFIKLSLYQGDGGMGLADLDSPATDVGAYIANSLGSRTESLSIAPFQSLLGTSTHAGIRFSSEFSANTSFDTFANFAPVLEIQYVPEPSGLAMGSAAALVACLAGLFRRRRGRLAR